MLYRMTSQPGNSRAAQYNVRRFALVPSMGKHRKHTVASDYGHHCLGGELSKCEGVLFH